MEITDKQKSYAALDMMMFLGKACDKFFEPKTKEQDGKTINLNPHAVISSPEDQGEIIIDACCLIIAQMIVGSKINGTTEEKQKSDQEFFSAITGRIQTHMLAYREQIEKELSDAKN